MIKYRKVTSLTALWSFVLLVLTSVILYIVPAGRVAYWADWRLWGLTKTQWTNLHINLGVLFLVAIGLHIYLNWKPIVSYLKSKAKKVTVFTRDFNIAAIITLVVIAGTYAEVPPFSSIIAIGDGVKDAAAVKYGEPPYGHAELSTLKTFAARMSWDLDEAVTRLKQNGIDVSGPDQTLLALAERHGVAPQQIYLAMKPPESDAPKTALPDAPPPGIGRRTLADIAQEYQLNIPALIRGLSGENIRATAEQSILDIAASHQMAPEDVYDIVKRTANHP